MVSVFYTFQLLGSLCRPPFFFPVNLRLRAVDGVKGLVQKQAERPAVVDPRWAVLVESGVVPQQGEEVRDDKGESGQGDEVRRHGHGEDFDDDIGVKGLEHVFGQQRVVDARVLVLFERWELLLTYVDHLGRVLQFVCC